ncbi:hypothetical protein QBC37DRAFT_428844, partial [Rhypophila decipiens]
MQEANSVLHTDSGYGSAPSYDQKGEGAVQQEPVLAGHPSDGLERIQEVVVEELDHDPYEEDAETVYTSVSSIDTEQQGYIAGFCSDLLYSLSVAEANVNPETMTYMEPILAGLLKEFAIKIGHNPPTPLHQEIMYFVRKYRQMICQQFHKANEKHDSPGSSKATGQDAGHRPEVPGPSRQMSPRDKFDMWQSKMEGSVIEMPPPEDLEGAPQEDSKMPSNGQENNPETQTDAADSDLLSNHDLTDPDEDSENVHEDDKSYKNYRDCLINSPDFSWLLETLTRQSLLSTPTPDTRSNIRRRIFSSLSTRKTDKRSRKESSKTYTVVFHMEWDPLSFIEEQKYGMAPYEGIASAITITGSDLEAQAISPREYFQQTWGSSSCILQLAQSIARQSPADRCVASALLRDQTKVVMESRGSIVRVRVYGSVPSIADVGEQLAWIGGALRPSPADEEYEGVWYCLPVIKSLEQCASISEVATEAPDCLFNIEFRVDKSKGKEKATNGNCWNGMFRNPVVVRGYPISRRTTPAPGLEATLGALVKLIRTDCVTEFDGGIFVKGFSSMLALTERTGDFMLWHLFYNPEGRVSYLDFTDEPNQSLHEAKLENYRHIVGWCPKVKVYAGASDGSYSIGNSGLNRPGAGCVLEKFALTGGLYVSANFTLALGVRDTPLFHQTRSEYLEKLNWISTRYAVLWDEETMRGWLVNGITALLHLVRASLECDKKNKTNPSHLFKPDEMQDSSTPYTADSAIEVLKSRHNRNLKLAEDKTEEWIEGEVGKDGTSKFKTTYVLFQNRVERLYAILEKILEYQTKVESQSGYNLKPRVRKYLEGWEFKALARREDPLYPVVKTLPARGKGWVDFSRDLDAITIFGYGFGEIMSPAQPDVMTCGAWSRVPHDQHYLAVSLSDLKDVTENYQARGKMHPSMVAVSNVKALVWHAPTPLFQECRCRRQTGNVSCTHSDVVQVLFPTRAKPNLPTTNSLPLTRQVEENPGGAVIFGQSALVKWRWKDQGDPEPGEPSRENEMPTFELEGDLGVNDSGIDTRTSGSNNGSIPPSADSVNITPQPSETGVAGSKRGRMRW